MRLFLLAAALAFLSGCRKEPAPAPKPDIAAAAEGPSEAASAGTLALKLPCGKDSALALYNDTSGDDANYIKHKRVDSVFSDSGYFVERSFYEGGDWLFISKRTCAELVLYGRPIFNSARTRFASISEDLEAGFMANGVQIISLETGTPQVKLEDKQDAWGPRGGTWTDDSTFVADMTDAEGHHRMRTYALRKGTWSAQDEGVPAKAARGADSLPYPEVEIDTGASR